MNYSSWKSLKIWITAILISVLFHFSVGAVCYGTMQKDDGYFAPPAALMLTFALEPEQPNIVDDSQQIATAIPVSEAIEDTIDDQAHEEKQDIIPPLPLPRPLENKEITENKKRIESKTTKIEKQKKIKKVSESKKTNTVQKKKNIQQKVATQQVTINTKQNYAGNTRSLLTQSNGASSGQWLAKVQSHLERQKNYLSRERSNKSKGSVKLRITVAANGTIQASQLISSSGSPELDQLALDVLKRSSPLPVPPAENVGQKINIPLIFR